jgi:hypothetical protein
MSAMEEFSLADLERLRRMHANLVGARAKEMCKDRTALERAIATLERQPPWRRPTR